MHWMRRRLFGSAAKHRFDGVIVGPLAHFLTLRVSSYLTPMHGVYFGLKRAECIRKHDVPTFVFVLACVQSEWIPVIFERVDFALRAKGDASSRERWERLHRLHARRPAPLVFTEALGFAFIRRRGSFLSCRCIVSPTFAFVIREIPLSTTHAFSMRSGGGRRGTKGAVGAGLNETEADATHGNAFSAMKKVRDRCAGAQEEGRGRAGSKDGQKPHARGAQGRG
eukprot:scaffold2549_cov333-Pavlova_lutheri.AAC.20